MTEIAPFQVAAKEPHPFKFVELVTAIILLVTRMRDLNTQLTQRLGQLTRKRPRSETLERIERQLALPFDVVATAPPRREDAGPAKVKKKRRAELAEPTPEQVADVARRTARRVADALRKAGKSLTPEFDTDHVLTVTWSRAVLGENVWAKFTRVARGVGEFRPVKSPRPTWPCAGGGARPRLPWPP